MHASPSQRPADTSGERRLRDTPMFWTATVVGLIVMAIALWLASGLWMPAPAAGSAEPRTVDMAGNSVVLEDPIASPEVLVEMDVDEDAGERFVVADVELDVPLGALDMVDGEITPPGFTSAYIVRNLGTPADAAAGTTYVVMHSIPKPGVAPGNYLIDVADGKASVEAGTTIQVGDASYAIDSSYTVDKAQLPQQTALWENRAGRLVVITCQQLPSGERSVQNTVIEAHLIAP